MFKKIILLAAFAAPATLATAQSQKDIQAIQQLIGCFNVSFNYAETFSYDTTVKRYAHPLDLRTVVELVHPLESSPKKYVLQHILVGVDGTIIKHWREDWEYEKNTIWLFDGDGRFVKKTLSPAEVKGKWLQSVWEVDDAPRYQGISNWVETNGQTFWLNTTDAALPRREYTKRSDYNVLERTNRIIVSPQGYMHEQDNKKIIRKQGTRDSILALEKGYNDYTRITNACTNAATFWTKEKDAYWKDVRAVWEEIMDKASAIELRRKVNNKLLYEELWEKESAGWQGAARKDALRKIITAYVIVR